MSRGCFVLCTRFYARLTDPVTPARDVRTTARHVHVPCFRTNALLSSSRCTWRRCPSFTGPARDQVFGGPTAVEVMEFTIPVVMESVQIGTTRSVVFSGGIVRVDEPHSEATMQWIVGPTDEPDTEETGGAY